MGVQSGALACTEKTRTRLGGAQEKRGGAWLAPQLIRARGGTGVALTTGSNKSAHQFFHNGPPEIVSRFHSGFQGTGVAISDKMEVTYNVTAEGDIVRDDKVITTVPSTISMAGETMARGPLVNLFGMRGEGLHGSDMVAQFVRGSQGTNQQRGGRRNGQGRRGR